jgi:fused signal recognition particle receptor
MQNCHIWKNNFGERRSNFEWGVGLEERLTERFIRMSIFHRQEEKRYRARLSATLSETKGNLSHRIQQVLGTGKSRITEKQIDALEEVLLTSDIGVETTLNVTQRVREESGRQHFITSFELKRALREELLRILKSPDGDKVPKGSPHVILVVGVNGVGKTSTVAKLAHRFRRDGRRVLISASDTFRAAAIEQLQIWAERVDCQLIKQGMGADPAAVLFDALVASRARGMEVLIVDTAGRLHNNSNLMMELEKMERVASREVTGAPHETLLVLDATTGQNGLVQARQFASVVRVSGLVVTKLDGSAKGGCVVAIAKELGLPICFVGVGEGVDDLIPFSPESFVDAMLSEDS